MAWCVSRLAYRMRHESARGEKLSVTPSSYVLIPDSANRVKMDLCFDISQDYFSKRSRLVIAPQLWANDSVKDEYIPLVLDTPIYHKP